MHVEYIITAEAEEKKTQEVQGFALLCKIHQWNTRNQNLCSQNPFFSFVLSALLFFLNTVKVYIPSKGAGNGNPLQYSCWEIPWTEEPGGLQSMELH